MSMNCSADGSDELKNVRADIYLMIEKVNYYIALKSAYVQAYSWKAMALTLQDKQIQSVLKAKFSNIRL